MPRIDGPPYTSPAATDDVSREKESSPELVNVHERMYRSFKAFGGEGFADVISRQHGTSVIGSPPEEVVEGPSRHRGDGSRPVPRDATRPLLFPVIWD